MNLFTRRQMIRRTAQTAGALALATPFAPLFAAPEKRRFRIGACDWSIGKQGDISGMELAKKIGLDGLQISLGNRQGRHEAAPDGGAAGLLGRFQELRNGRGLARHW